MQIRREQARQSTVCDTIATKLAAFQAVEAAEAVEADILEADILAAPVLTRHRRQASIGAKPALFTMLEAAATEI